MPLPGIATGPLAPDEAAEGDRQILAALEIPDFTPVPVRNRRDGWTAFKQRRFLIKLVDCGSVRRAANSVGMTSKSAYRLKDRPDAKDFRDAWGIALMVTQSELAHFVLDRTIEGRFEPVLYRGRIVGQHKVHDPREIIHLMRAFNREQSRFDVDSQRRRCAEAAAEQRKTVSKVTQTGPFAASQATVPQH